jgi:DNA-binding NarL/FixJ family response regulator
MTHILIIEDQPVMRKNLSLMLQMEGYELSTASNGREGIDTALKRPPDLILCDIMMPEADGYEVLRTLRANEPTRMTPFIFLTAKGEKPDIRSGMNLGADDYLTKPVESSDLLAAVETRLARHAAHQHALSNVAATPPDFTSPAPIEKALGVSPREAEVLLWVAQGKSNGEISTILGAAEGTIKRHLSNVFDKLGIDSRHAATIQVLEVLSAVVKSQLSRP